MDSIINVGIKVVECFVGPVDARAKLITNHKTIMEDWRNKHQQLLDLRSIVQNRVSKATSNVDNVIQEVNTWLAEVDNATEDTKNGIGPTRVVEPKCGPCLDCCKAYKLSKEAIEKKKSVDSLIERGKAFENAEILIPSSPQGMRLVPQVDEFRSANSTESSLKEAIQYLKDPKENIVSLLGMGGIGKTTMAKEIGKRLDKDKVFNVVLFVVLSQQPSIKNIQLQLIEDLGMNCKKESVNGRAGQLKEKIKLEDNILIILDDVWEYISLAEIGIPFGNDHPGCKILLTTRREEVCQHMKCTKVIPLKLLDIVEARVLFEKNVGNVPTNVKDYAEEIIKECQGLPLALVVVARALDGRDLDSDWKSAAAKIKEGRLQEIEACDRHVFRCLKLSYDFLKSDDTKKCFLLCSLFPEDHEINLEELHKYASGFGLYRNAYTFENFGSKLKMSIKDLLSCSLLLKTDTMSGFVKVHDVVRSVALWITTTDKEPFIAPLEKVNWLKEAKEAVAISLLSCQMNTRFFNNQEQCPRLKIFVCAQRVHLELRKDCFQGLTALQVLDLTAAKMHLKMVLPSSLKDLKNLQTLLLRRWKLEGDISMIGSLINLEFLSFSGSLFTHLPIELGNLSELKILDLSGCDTLNKDSYIRVHEQLPRIEDLFTPLKQPKLAFDDEDDDIHNDRDDDESDDDA